MRRFTKMPESDPLNGLDLEEAIDLRWTLRDIRARRWKLSPLNPSHLEKLKSMNLIEMHDNEPGTHKGRIRCSSLTVVPHALRYFSSNSAMIIGAAFVACALVDLAARLVFLEF